MEKVAVPELERIFTGLILPFYAIRRDMQVPGEARPETDAEHCWSVGFVANALAPSLAPELDPGKVAQLAQVHDLVEIHAGDTSIWDSVNVETKARREAAALEKIKRSYADNSWLVESISEYEAKSSPEANYVWAIDKLAAMMMRYLGCLQGDRYYISIGLSKSNFISGLEPTRQKAYAHPRVGEYFDEVVSRVLEHDDWFTTDSVSPPSQADT